MNSKNPAIVFIVLLLASIPATAQKYTLQNDKLCITIQKNMGLIVSQKRNGEELQQCSSDNILRIKADGRLLRFDNKDIKIQQQPRKIIISAIDQSKEVQVFCVLKSDKKYASSISGDLTIRNIAKKEIKIDTVTFFNAILDATTSCADSSYKFWTFQGGTYKTRPDWIFPLSKDFARENFMGNNDPDYGGGMPIVDFWTKKSGIAFASISMKPELISLPVSVDKAGKVSFRLVQGVNTTLMPNAKFNFVPVAIISHNGDYFNAMQVYSSVMQDRGLKIPDRKISADEPEWCAWGYARNFDPKQIINTLPTARKLNFVWATLDDGWQDADGDWGLDRKKFPNGEKDFMALADSIHANKLKARLWWVPLTASDSQYNAKKYPERMNEYGMKVQSKLAIEHPDWFITDSTGNRYQVEWWNSYVLCPAVPEVREYYKKFITKAIKEWGFDGFKIDGQNMNSVPPCYNPAHHHKTPYKSTYAVPEYFKMVYNTTYALKKDAVIQLCPCGTNFSLYNIPYTTQFVGSDPSSSWQVRHRAKTFRALVGNKIPYSGDHVELTNRRWDEKLQKSVQFKPEDFASVVGLGGVVASKFTLPGPQEDSTLVLSPEKYAIWEKWQNISKTEKLVDGEYLNLYDIAYDIPETHVIKNGKVMYYTFFSEKQFNGKVELRGLKNRAYTLINCLNNAKICDINGKSPIIDVIFSDFMLIKAVEKD